MSLPKRKQTRLKDYDYSQNNAYYITTCTYNRAHLFGDIVGPRLCARSNEPDKMLIRWILELEHKYENVIIDHYIVMPDHIHFILFILGVHTSTAESDPDSGAHIGAPLPEMIKWFKTQTTNEYIKGVKNGLYPPFANHIWQRNYYEHIIRSERELHEIRKYIDENPLVVGAHLCVRPVLMRTCVHPNKCAGTPYG